MSGAGTAARDTGLPEGAHPLLRLLPLARPVRGRLLLAVLAAAAATGCGVALLGTSGFLLARASQHPSILAISGAVVAVRAFSVGRGVFRYAERVSSHDVAFRVLAGLRVRVYRRLERIAPAGLHAFRSGDLLARLVSDVDATQELFLRGRRPAARRRRGRGRRGGCRVAAAVRPGRDHARGRDGWPGECWCPGSPSPAPAGRPAVPRAHAAGSAPASPTCWPGRPTCTRSAPATMPWPACQPPTAT